MGYRVRTDGAGAAIAAVAAAHAAALILVGSRLHRTIGVVAPAPGDWTPAGLIAVGALAVASLAAGWRAARRSRASQRGAAFAAALGIATGDGLLALGVFFHALSAVVLGASVAGAATGLGSRGALRRNGLLATAAGVATGLYLSERLIRHFGSLSSIGAWEALVVIGVTGVITISGCASMIPRRRPV